MCRGNIFISSISRDAFQYFFYEISPSIQLNDVYATNEWIFDWGRTRSGFLMHISGAFCFYLEMKREKIEDLLTTLWIRLLYGKIIKLVSYKWMNERMSIFMAQAKCKITEYYMHKWEFNISSIHYVCIFLEHIQWIGVSVQMMPNKFAKFAMARFLIDQHQSISRD